MRGHPRWFKPGLLVVAASLLLSGVLLAPSMLMMRAEMDVPWHLDGGQRVLVAAWHALSALLGTWTIGALWTVHMRAGWRRRLQRLSGVMLVSLLAILALSALGIYYLGDEEWSLLTAWVHVVVGGVIVLPFVWHVWIAPWRRMRLIKAVGPVASSAPVPRSQPALARRNTAR